jgi:hypothetical protein
LTSAQSSTDGYTVGGYHGGTYNSVSNIDSVPFSAPFTKAAAGSLTGADSFGFGASSSTDGFKVGGQNNTLDINKFPFSAPFTTASVHGTLSAPVYTGASMQSSDTAFMGGLRRNGSRVSGIYSYSLITFTTETVGGYLAGATDKAGGVSSSSDGYIIGGYSPEFGGPLSNIRTFPFSSPYTTTVDVGNLHASPDSLTSQNGVSGDTDGYMAGFPGGNVNQVDKFPFSAPFTIATDVGDINAAGTYEINYSATFSS